MTNNLKEIKTTAIGIVLFSLGLVIMLKEYFTIGEVAWSIYILPISLIASGIGFMLAPDRLLDLLFKWGNKKVDSEK